MARGIRRTTILSHGGRHDAQGVKGTHLAGTVPAKAVIAAIPDAMNTVGNLPETQAPGTAGEVMRSTTPVEVRTGKSRIRMDEGIPVIPGGNRDAGRGPSTSRPQLDDVSAPVPTRSSSGATVPAPVPAAPPEAPIEPRGEALVPPVDDMPPPEPKAVTGAVEPPLPTTRRKLARASKSRLRDWCGVLNIKPEEYVDDDSLVTGDLMRALIGDELGIEHGIVLLGDEADEG